MNFIKKIIISSLIFILLAVVSANVYTFPRDTIEMIKLEKTAVSKIPSEMVIGLFFSIAVDTKGNIFAAADMGKELCIIKFSPTLNYISSFSRSGKGPGDLSDRPNLSVDVEGNVYAASSNPQRINIFDNNGKYLKKEISMAKLGHWTVREGMIMNDLHFAALYYNPSTMKSEGVILSVNPPKMTSLYKFTEIPIITEGGNKFVGADWGPYTYFDSDHHHMVFSNSQLFSFSVFDINGRLILEKTDQKRKLNTFSNEEMDEMTDSISKSESMKVFYRKNYDKIKASKNIIKTIKISGNKIYVFTVGNTLLTNSYPVEIYDLKGNLVKKGTMSSLPEKIVGNFAYCVDRDSEDNPLIIKYRIIIK